MKVWQKSAAGLWRAGTEPRREGGRIPGASPVQSWAALGLGGPQPTFCCQSRPPALLPLRAPLGRTCLSILRCLLLCFFSSVYLSSCEMRSCPSQNPRFFSLKAEH